MAPPVESSRRERELDEVVRVERLPGSNDIIVGLLLL
jgi:hypothetical protein